MGLDISILNTGEKYFPEEQKHRHLDMSVGVDEWEALFFEELKCPADEVFNEGEDIAEYNKRQKQRFLSTLDNFPMLSRISSYYSDSSFYGSDVQELLKECVYLKKTVKNKKAVSFLNKLIFACSQAINNSSGISLYAD